MTLKNKILVITIILILFSIFIASSTAVCETNYINIISNGEIQFNTTGFEFEKTNTGFHQDENYTCYNITDSEDNWAEITIHHSSMNDPDSLELEYMNAEFYRPWGMWIGNYSGDYYSLIITESSDDSYFDTEFVQNRIIYN